MREANYLSPEVREATVRDLAQYVGMKIKLRRIEAGLTLDQLSEKSGITKAALSNIENGKSDARLSTIAVIRSVLALDISIEPMGPIIA